MGNIVNRVFDSSGPEGKVRGTPQQIIDKYNQLARDAHLGNDRVAAENFQQHAEHYLRMLAEAQKEQQERQQQQQQHQNNQGGQQNNENRQHQPAEQPRNVQDEQADSRDRQKRPDDVIDVEADASDSALVETPENRAPKPRRSRKKAPDAEPKAEDAAPQDAAE